MPFYTIDRHVLVVQTELYEVEAASEAEARELFDNGESTYLDCDVGGEVLYEVDVVVALRQDPEPVEPEGNEPVTFPPAVDPLARMEE